MEIIGEIRRQRHLSQRALAMRAGISFPCLQQLERPGHNWRVSSLRGVAKALGLPKQALDYHLTRAFTLVTDSVEDASLRIHAEGISSWKIHLFDFVDRFRAVRDVALIESGPIPELDGRLQNLFAATTEALCAEAALQTPAWCTGIRALPEPWFVAGMESLKASALVESPVSFRARNIFVLGNFLSRA
jgi:transcriptional regulator with XRE-family HTH domain